jgi:ATP synthase protein I
VSENLTTIETLNPETNKSGESISEYDRLQQNLASIALVATAIIFGVLWLTSSLNLALNYAIGACTGVVYLRMLGRDVARLGPERRKLSKARFALFIGLIIIAARWDRLQVMPVFLGFLTYKAAILIYMLRGV